MINFFDQVPTVYSSASRDFQYIGWLVNVVFNSVKHNVDDIYDLPSVPADSRLTEVLAMTLGFKIKRNYDKKQLAALVSIIPSILKYKGTIQAIEMAGFALLGASGATGRFDCKVVDNCLEVLFPKELIDTTLFTDLLPYILPAGMTCRIVRKTELQNIYSTDVAYDDLVQAKWHKDLSWRDDKQTSTGLANIFDVDESKVPSFALYKSKASNEELNTGLLDNSVIPVLDQNDILTDTKTNHLKDEEL